MKRERVDRPLDWRWAAAGWLLSWQALGPYCMGSVIGSVIVAAILALPAALLLWHRHIGPSAPVALEILIYLAALISLPFNILCLLPIVRGFSAGPPGYFFLPLGLALAWAGLWTALNQRSPLDRIACGLVLGLGLALAVPILQKSHKDSLADGRASYGWRFKWDGPEAKRP